MAWLKFGGSTSFTDSHETVQNLLGNMTWFNQYEPRGEDRIAEVVYGYAIQWDYVAPLSASMPCIGPGN